jgi:acetyl-CoA carboxylase biotin carboxylase subunit
VSRLERAFEELFVAGIKTNVALFQRILADEDFRSGKLDTGYLERLLRSAADGGRKDASNIAAIAAAVLALLDSISKVAGNGTSTGDADARRSGWKNAARTEGLS